MQEKLPKTNQEYRAILKESWGIDIDKDEVIGRYSLSKSGTQGFFNNCTTIDGGPLKYPEDNYPLRITIWGDVLKTLTPEKIYRFKVQLASTDKRIQLKKPLLLVTKWDSITEIDSTNKTFSPQEENSETTFSPNSNLKSVLNSIYHEKLNQNNPFNVIDLAEAVEALAIDIYSENKRFIYELIQNADDAAVLNQSELRIEIASGYVVLSHNGKPFDERDLRGLCGIGRGTKRDDEAKTGYKGIGFKSVFGQPGSLVYVKTNELLFRFDRNYVLENGWNTKWGNQEIWEKKNQTKFKSPWQLIPIVSESTNNDTIDQILNLDDFTVKTAIKIRNEAGLAKDIQALFSDARFLLFLRKIYKVTLVHSSNSLCISKKTDEDAPGIISLYKNDLNISNWYLRTDNYKIPDDIRQELKQDINSPKKLQEMIRAELSFAIRLESDLKSVSLLPSSESCIFTYLPTSVTEFDFPFLVNSNFLVDAGREKIHKDRIWNKWLFKVIGWELVKCCAEMAKSNTLSKDCLKLLLPDYLPNTDALKNAFNEGLKIGFEKVEFILNNDNQLVRLPDIIIDEVGIINSNIISKNYIIDFINDDSNPIKLDEQNFLPIFTDSKKLIHFGARTFSQEKLKVFLQSEMFLSSHQLSQNYSLLKYLKKLDSNDHSGEWNYVIKNNTFIYSDKESLERIPLVCFPVTTYVTNFGEENTLIAQELYNSFSHDSNLVEWLKTLGVKEPSELAYLEKEIIGRIDNIITSENYIDITGFLINLHLSKLLQTHHYNSLRELPLKTLSGWKRAKDCYLSKAYNPTIDFSKYLGNSLMVSDSYTADLITYECRSFFLSIAVSEDIEILNDFKIESSSIDKFYLRDAIEFAKPGHSYPHLIKETYPNGKPVNFHLNYITFLDKTNEFNFSVEFWSRLLTKYELNVSGKIQLPSNYGNQKEEIVYKLNSQKLSSIDYMGWGWYDHNRTYIPSYFLWYIKTKKCIPTNQKLCYSASEVFTNSDKILELGGDYLPIIQVSKALSKGWSQLLGLKSKLVLEDLLKIISSINNEVKEKGFLKRDNEKRLGLVYNEIIDSINELSIQEEDTIREWAKKNKFLCNDYLSRKASGIVWIRVEGFKNYDEKIHTILIPKNVIIDERTEKLFVIFGIQIIDSCVHEVIEQKDDTQIHIKILEFLPALSLVLRARMKIKDEEEYLDTTFKAIENFTFSICKNILLVLNYGEAEIKGSSVKYYLSDEGLYYTSSWQNPLERFAISQYLATFLKCKGFEQEIQLYLELTDYQLSQYLESVGLSIEAVKPLPIYEQIQEKIILLRESIRTNRIININSTFTQNQTAKNEYDLSDLNESAPEFNNEKEEVEDDFIKEVEDFIRTELEDTEWADYIPELKNILELSIAHPKEKQKLYNLIAKLKLAKATLIHFDKADKDYNRLVDGEEKYYIHSARGAFAYIHPTEILSMRDNGYKMALDFGSKFPIKLYDKAEDILSLNTNHLLAYQYEKTMNDLFMFCEYNKDAHKHLLIVDKDVSRGKSNDIFKLLNPEDDYQ